MLRQTLPKTEILNREKLITQLFGSGSKAVSAFPLRVVYRKKDGIDPNQVLISVPKRHLHRANKRNRVKRQVREAYRKNKGIIAGENLLVAFLWLDDKLYSSASVEEKVVNLLTRIKEKLQAQEEQAE